jgi:hypothetical protein
MSSVVVSEPRGKLRFFEDGSTGIGAVMFDRHGRVIAIPAPGTTADERADVREMAEQAVLYGRIEPDAWRYSQRLDAWIAGVRTSPIPSHSER